MNSTSRIYIAGHKGLVGSHIYEVLKKDGFKHLIVYEHTDLDLTDQSQVKSFFKQEKPEYVFLAAARVGGIWANNTYPAEFITENLQIECNVMSEAYKNRVDKLLFLGSSCIYPRECLQPIKEEYLLNGYLEPTNEAYALAKIIGVKMCTLYKRQYGADFISNMPSKLYGPGDKFDGKKSNVIHALIEKMHKAKLLKKEKVEIWGSSKALREFLYVEDLARACIFAMKEYSGESHLNVGSGEEISIYDLAKLIKIIVGFKGELVFNQNSLDGTPRKILDSSKIQNMGWKCRVKMEEGLKSTYNWYLENNGVE